MRRPSASVTNTELLVPARWIARRHAARLLPGGTVTGSRVAITVSGWEARVGTRAATARSVSSATGPVYADPPEGAVDCDPVAAVRGTGVTTSPAGPAGKPPEPGG